MSEFNTREFIRSDGRQAAHGDAAAALSAPAPSSPFELIPTGEAFGVCDLDGVCS
ncbi:hypothetical protein ACFS27_02505 [Promicromonospora vindobonensis]|uniref:Uncharacterized protein n=1 Tax=Promicromonospora vindobonensis TaxID=195748 RepID=A0ABW5VN80_9MICO